MGGIGAMGGMIRRIPAGCFRLRRSGGRPRTELGMIALAPMNLDSAVGIVAKERRERKEKGRQSIQTAVCVHPLYERCIQPLCSFFAFLAFFCGSTGAEVRIAECTIHG